MTAGIETAATNLSDHCMQDLQALHLIFSKVSLKSYNLKSKPLLLLLLYPFL